MKNKTILFVVLPIVVIIIGLFLYIRKTQTQLDPEQAVLASTYDISREYLTLRYQTDNVLVNTKEFSDYEAWNRDVTKLIKGWSELETKAAELENTANTLVEQTAQTLIIPEAYAYDKEEISRIIDSAPLGKKIMTLAQHLGVDAKRAQLILNQDQAMVTNEAWTEAGDVFQGLESDAVRLKNGCKVAGFVGGVVLSGGVSAIAASGTVATTALVVTGADLTLEIADDEAKIAYGDKNKVSEMVGKLRTVTEPAASILTIVNIPGNLSKGVDKLAAVSFGADQIRSVAQDEKVLGINIKVESNGDITTEAAALNQEEVDQWMKDNNVSKSKDTIEEILATPESNEAEQNTNTVVEEGKPLEDENKGATTNNTKDIPNQLYKIVNTSNEPYMIDVCHTPTCWDDLAAKPEEDIDVGGIYTKGKVYATGESFTKGFRPADMQASGRLVEPSANRYKIVLYFAIAPFQGEHKTIEYGTWQSQSIEIQANYGDEPLIEWDGSSLKQVN